MKRALIRDARTIGICTLKYDGKGARLNFGYQTKSIDGKEIEGNGMFMIVKVFINTKQSNGCVAVHTTSLSGHDAASVLFVTLKGAMNLYSLKSYRLLKHP